MLKDLYLSTELSEESYTLFEKEVTLNFHISKLYVKIFIQTLCRFFYLYFFNADSIFYSSLFVFYTVIFRCRSKMIFRNVLLFKNQYIHIVIRKPFKYN